MFIFSVKSPLKKEKLRVVLFAVISLVVLLLIIAGVSHYHKRMPDSAYSASTGEYSLCADSEQKRQDFLAQFSLDAGELYSACEIAVPPVFNDTYTKYNELMQKQGLDLEPYKGREAQQYVYKLDGCMLDNSQAYATLLVYREKVIGGHISSLEYSKGMYTFTGE